MLDDKIKSQLIDLWNSNDGVFDARDLKLYGLDFSQIPFGEYKKAHDLFVNWMGDKKFHDKLNNLLAGKHRVELEDDSIMEFYVDSYALENAPFKIKYPKTVALNVIPTEFDDTLEHEMLESMAKDAIQEYFNEDVRLDNLGLIVLGVDLPDEY
jgi:hypothetical protein